MPDEPRPLHGGVDLNQPVLKMFRDFAQDISTREPSAGIAIAITNDGQVRFSNWHTEQNILVLLGMLQFVSAFLISGVTQRGQAGQ